MIIYILFVAFLIFALLAIAIIAHFAFKNAKPTTVNNGTVHNHYYAQDKPDKPDKLPPGSNEKIMLATEIARVLQEVSATCEKTRLREERLLRKSDNEEI
jgi:hypothetical protein